MQTEGRNERAETRCSQSRKRTPSSQAAKEVHRRRKTAIMKELGTKMDGKEAASKKLRIFKK